MAWCPDGGVWMMMTMTIISFVQAEDSFRFFDLRVTYGNISLNKRNPPERVILINGKFPGPELSLVTNDNLIINVHNGLDEPFLLSWNGLHLKRNSYQDGVYGTTCPIPPGKNYTYDFHVGDQIGSFFYFPSLGVQKAAGGFGAIRILSRPGIPVPFPQPAGDFTLLIGDWYLEDYKNLTARLDGGRMIHRPFAVLINGNGNPASTSLTVDKGKTYRFRISNVGLQMSLNFEILGHMLKLVEVEGTYTIQSMYTSLDIHVGQSLSVLVTMDQPPQNYTIVARTRFTDIQSQNAVILKYSNTKSKTSKFVPRIEPGNEVDFSIKQARSIKTNLTASRQNAEGSYHYGRIKISRTLILESSAGVVNRKQRYAINGVSFVPADTPLKLADYFKIKGVFKVGSIPDKPGRAGIRLETAVMGVHHKDFLEIVLLNHEKIVQTYHLDGYNFWVVGIGNRWSTWSPASRREYNLKDAISRSTTQVYQKSWTAVYVALDNVGMWNFRSEFWARQYLGQQFYFRVHSPASSIKDEYPLPKNALLCGQASNRHRRDFTP
ncbi:SKU5 similar 9 [Raphanus sativus]|uniref:L-ascorbate oxidase homolog n=1 Tax=Raphanus sativus TaxID=3726 RepID=A0A9W3C9F8_RAPSA|nr:L-ascorbate oxidase homolog [Raphanus sativus]KAJ4909972.1 SKU5 similar 9 [Raphanus sativus]